MACVETRNEVSYTVELTCEALLRKRGEVCGNYASVTTNTREQSLQFMFDLGWRLCKGRTICRNCVSKGIKNLHFPRKRKETHA